MARPFTPKVLTANRLLQGDVVYLSVDGQWVEHHKDAKLFEDEGAAKAALQIAQGQADILVGVYLADATLCNGQPTPRHFRERFRAKGPSNYAHGKQEELDNL